MGGQMVNSTHLIALALTIGLYLTLALAYFGWGEILCRGFRLDPTDPADRLPITGRLWLGWAITLTLLQAIHFFCPIDVRCVVPVLAVGLIVAIANGRKWRPSRSPAMLAMGLLLLIAAIWIASRSMLRPWNYDSGLYHFQAIRWINEYPLVPGLGNLHGRLAFNQSFFTYAAATNLQPWFGHGRSVANGFLWLLTLATLIDLTGPAWNRPRRFFSDDSCRYGWALLFLPVMIHLALDSDGLGSPTPDLASTLLQIVMTGLLIQGMAWWESGVRHQKSRAIWLTVLAVTAITIKLSNLMFAGTMLLIVLVYLGKTRCWRLALGVGLLCLSMIAVWWSRGIVLSGAPLYPSTLGYWPTDWAMPKDRIIQEMHVTLAWARAPDADWTQVIGSSDWIKPWLHRMLQEKTMLVAPLLVTLIATGITLVLAIFRPAARLKSPQMVLMVPLLASLAYWFFTAPDLRFAHSLFFMLPIVGLLWMWTACRAVLSRSAHRALTVLCLLGLSMLWIAPVAKNITAISLAGWYPIKTVPTEKRVTQSGLEVNWPSSGNQAWDSPLPGTPYFDKALKLRPPSPPATSLSPRASLDSRSLQNPADLARGFKLAENEK